jgi:hypothetical protein
MHLNHATRNIYIIKTIPTTTPSYMYAYARSSEPLAQETESQTQIAESQTHIAESQTQIAESQTHIAESQTHITKSQVVPLSMQCIMSPPL